MPIQIVSNPPENTPIAVSECMAWSFQLAPADVFTTPGSAATAVITFQANPSAPSDGTQFKLWGRTLTVDGSSDFTPSSFKVVNGNAANTITNFVGMLESNYFFTSAVDIEVDYTARTVTLVWRSCGEQPNFGSADMDFAPIASAASLSATNGVDPVFRENFKFLVRVYRRDLNGTGSGYITEYEGVQVSKGCSSVGAITFDAMPIARSVLATRIPQIDLETHPSVHFDGPLQYFSLQHGYTFNEGAQGVSGEFGLTNVALALNAYFEPGDAYRMRRYWPGMTGGYPPGQSHRKFLTTRPAVQRVFTSSRCWLWFLVNEGVETIGTLVVRYVVNLKNGNQVANNVVITNSGYGINAVNASPSVAATATGQQVSNIASYTVSILNDNQQITEVATFLLDDACFGGRFTDVYFLGKMGGIETLPCEIVEEEAVQQGDEVLLDVACGVGRHARAAYGGRTLSNVRSFRTYTFRARAKSSDADVEFFRHMKASPQRWVRFSDDEGKPIAVKLIVEPGSIRVFKAGEFVELVFKGYINDAPVQAGVEPEFV